MRGDDPMFAACTIVSRNYLHFARTLCRSFLAQHPHSRFFVLVVDRADEGRSPCAEPFETVWVEELGLPDFRSIAFKFSILELNTNVKPSFLKWLLANRGLERLIYLDPDIFVYSPLVEVDTILRTKDLVLTPHILSPIEDNKRPAESDFLRSGVFNLGFIGVSNRAGSLGFLDWWERRCLSKGFSEQSAGLFVDQKWLDLAPCLFAGTEILRSPAYNVAYWNLHERRIDCVGGRSLVNGAEELRFFHFSGVDVKNLSRVSKYQDRFSLAERTDLTQLFEAYVARLRENGLDATSTARYGFGYFSNGARINDLTRRVYAFSLDKFDGVDPFDADGEFFRFVKRAGVLSPEQASATGNAAFPGAGDVRVRLIHGCLRLALRILGPDRYVLLMRYLAHVSLSLNQRSVFWRD